MNLTSFCIGCNESTSKCTKCDLSAQRVLNPNTGACDCIGGTYANTSNSCSSCPIGCKTCFNQECFTCYNNSQSQAPPCKCPAGTYADVQSLSCLACSPYCASCTNPQQCLTCKSNFKTLDGQCYCENGRYITTNGECLACVANCAFCNSSSCGTCKDGSYLTTLGFCVTECINNNNPAIGNCKRCDASCSRCGSNYECTACNTGLLLNGKCV